MNKFKFLTADQDHVAELVRNAHVETRRVIDHGRHVCAEIVVNGEHTHRFAHTSRVSKALANEMTPAQLSERLSGGQYFFVDDHLVDWRDQHYTGFVHTDDTIKAFMDTIGISTLDDMSVHRRRMVMSQIARSSGDVSPVQLRRTWTDHDIEVPGYQEGGHFTSSVGFEWSPFVHFVTGSFDLVRQICTNGMVGIANFLNVRVPVQNRWSEHLEIAAAQLTNNVTAQVSNRVLAMGKERASLAECMLAADHAHARQSGGITTAHDLQRLSNIQHACDPRVHLSQVYQPAVFENNAVAAQQPGHLTRLDVYNVVTELATHYPDTKDSSSRALHRQANAMMFPLNEAVDPRKTSLVGGRATLAGFSDPDRAFFGSLE